jgi:hypothetical protein
MERHEVVVELSGTIAVMSMITAITAQSQTQTPAHMVRG